MTSVLRPGYLSSVGGVVLMVVLVLGLAAVVEVVRRPGRGAAPLLAIGAAVAAVVRLALPRPEADVVPGLVMAFPLLVWGLLAALTDRERRGDTIDLVAVSALFGALVVATQYRDGGAWTWGGRFFAIALPVVCPVIAVGLARLAGSEGGSTVVAGLTVASLVVVASGWHAVARTHDINAEIEMVVGELADEVAGASGGGPPIVVTTEPDLPRLAWRSALEGPGWLLVEDRDDLPEVVAALTDAGVSEFVVVTQDADGVRDSLPGGAVVTDRTVGTPEPGAWWAAVVATG